MTILAGDAGGTKTRLALYERTSSAGPCALERLVLADFESRSAPSLEEIVRGFLERNNAAGRIEAACIGLPGPVVGGSVRATNLPWVIEESAFGESLGIPKVRLVNDHAATAAALPLLGPEELITLHPGREERERRVFAVLAPGTGLGQAYSVRCVDGRLQPFPSEGGHVEFAPKDELEFDLLKYLQEKLHKRVSVERVLSGPGILNIYSFLRDRSRCDEPEALRAEIAAAPAPAAVVSGHGLSGKYAICSMTLDIFARLLGSQAGDVVLTYLSTGGLFLGGGIPPKVAAKLQEGGAVEAYLRKGRLSPLVEMTPLHVIKNDRTALLGAAAIAAGL
ncbi:MAG: glucokinase [Desulfobacterales bacterium]|jgi:glucokinase|nr:glucokinase [Desulfobacterales bacterium]